MSNIASQRDKKSFAAPFSLAGNRASDALRCVGNWQLTQLAGCGAFSDVFLAKPFGCRADWPADYAVKVLRPRSHDNPDALQSLRREVEVASQVSSRHLVTVLEAHLSGKSRFLVMPKLDGFSVGQVIQRVGHLSVRQSLWIARQTCEALEALHQQRWLHGDVKPKNIMVSPTGHVTLIDLGFAVRFSQAVFTETRTAKGTLQYVAPETMTSAFSSDQRSDIYSLGISLFHMLTGSLPFTTTNAGELIDAHRGQPIPDPRRFHPDIPGNVVSLLSRMTAKHPIRRPQSAQEVIQRLLPLEVEAMKRDREKARPRRVLMMS